MKKLFQYRMWIRLDKKEKKKTIYKRHKHPSSQGKMYVKSEEIFIKILLNG